MPARALAFVKEGMGATPWGPSSIIASLLKVLGPQSWSAAGPSDVPDLNSPPSVAILCNQKNRPRQALGAGPGKVVTPSRETDEGLL